MDVCADWFVLFQLYLQPLRVLFQIVQKSAIGMNKNWSNVDKLFTPWDIVSTLMRSAEKESTICWKPDCFEVLIMWNGCHVWVNKSLLWNQLINHDMRVVWLTLFTIIPPRLWARNMIGRRLVLCPYDQFLLPPWALARNWAVRTFVLRRYKIRAATKDIEWPYNVWWVRTSELWVRES